jgi:hypothetical protein
MMQRRNGELVSKMPCSIILVKMKPGLLVVGEVEEQ